jgi:hypothetical protein
MNKKILILLTFITLNTIYSEDNHTETNKTEEEQQQKKNPRSWTNTAKIISAALLTIAIPIGYYLWKLPFYKAYEIYKQAFYNYKIKNWSTEDSIKKAADRTLGLLTDESLKDYIRKIAVEELYQAEIESKTQRSIKKYEGYKNQTIINNNTPKT